MRRPVLAHIASLVAVLLLPSPSSALKFSPFTAELDPAGRGATRSYKLENETSKPIAVQLTVSRRQMDIDGKEQLIDAEDDFIIYPPQLILKPRSSQTVRLQWIGNPNPERELAYRVIAEQLPVNLDKSAPDRASVELLVRYAGAVYIVPKGARGRIVVESVASATTSDGSKALVLILYNAGSKHVGISKPTLKLRSSKGERVELAEPQLPGVSGVNILSGLKRRFFVPWPEQLSDGPLEAEFDFTPI